MTKTSIEGGIGGLLKASKQASKHGKAYDDASVLVHLDCRTQSLPTCIGIKKTLYNWVVVFKCKSGHREWQKGRTVMASWMCLGLPAPLSLINYEPNKSR